MARGWESKSVESQQEEKAANLPDQKALTTDQQQKQRDIGGLRLSRQRVLDELTRVGDTRHEAILRAALADLNAQLKALE